MSRLTDLLRQLRQTDTRLAQDFEAEISHLTNRRTFGLVFEPHQPEAVELPARSIQRGDKVRILAPRGDTTPTDPRLWRVQDIEHTHDQRVAHLVEANTTEQPQTHTAPTDDLVVVAEFTDRIYPGLIETGRIERGGDKPFHTVINAENYHALELLTYTHRHSIDAIYIDPPYNSGAKDWKYNNNYVAEDDHYRHSKWLAFMQRRLHIASQLLNPNDSVLIVTIDEKEYLRLGLLLEQTFPEARIQMVTTVVNPSGAARSNAFSRTDEYIYFVQFGNSVPSQTSSDMLYPTIGDKKKTPTTIWNNLRRRGNNNRRVDRPNSFYPIFVNLIDGRIVGAGPKIEGNYVTDGLNVPVGCTAVLPILPDGTDGTWQLGRETFLKRIPEGTVRSTTIGNALAIQYLRQAELSRIEKGVLTVVGKSHAGALEVSAVSNIADTITAKTTWNMPSHSAGTGGTSLLRAMLPDRRFPFPKSLYAVEDTLRFFVKDKPDAKILDFFAGSGTTAHAVMRLNKQDGGRRQSISVTNNEVSAEEQRKLRTARLRPGDPDWEALGICDYITKPRITAAITGQTPKGEPIKGDYRFTDEFPMAEGFKENAAYFTLTYETPLAVRHHRAFKRIAPMLWLRAGAQGRIITDLGDQGWDIAQTYAVLENFDHTENFLTAVRHHPSCLTVYIITDDDAAFQMICRELPDNLPTTQLYESYLHNFTLNQGQTH